jgi:hypothetical protein
MLLFIFLSVCIIFMCLLNYCISCSFFQCRLWYLQGASLKISKFLPPSSDDEISEESIHSPRVQEMKEEDIQDSPRSCVIPPPCKPPRSWDLIQSGVIDDPKVRINM